MAGFWESLESTAKTKAEFGRDRQRRHMEARNLANAFFDRMNRDAARLQTFGLNVTASDTTVSFRRSGLEMLAVTFGTNDGTQNRIFSPVIEYLKLTPSYQDIKMDQDIDAPAGSWLGRSIEVVEKNHELFSVLGLI